MSIGTDVTKLNPKEKTKVLTTFHQIHSGVDLEKVPIKNWVLENLW